MCDLRADLELALRCLLVPRVASRGSTLNTSGSSYFGGAQLAIDTTIVSTLHANGASRRFHEDGAALEAARRVKERRCPELVGRCWAWRFVAVGPWILELFGRRVQSGLFSCTAARSVAMSLLELPGVKGADGYCPTGLDT